mmetsp:Transcript_140487/g.436851  ORF Transcript_140487/g.436851 Transcript_140487/m.436851 type:complete len:373 (+) Transcript_140487:23-1141(+)
MSSRSPLRAAGGPQRQNQPPRTATPCTPPKVMGINDKRRMKARTCCGCSSFSSHGLCAAATERSCVAPSKSCSPSKTDKSSSSTLAEAARRRCSHCPSESEVCMPDRGSSQGLSLARHGLAQSRTSSRAALRRLLALARSPQRAKAATEARPEGPPSSASSACAAAHAACLWHRPTYHESSSRLALPADLQEAASCQRAESWSTGITAIATSGSLTQRLSSASVSSGMATMSRMRRATSSGLRTSSARRVFPSRRSKPVKASAATFSSSSARSLSVDQNTATQIKAMAMSPAFAARQTPMAPTSGSSSSAATSSSSSKCRALRTSTVTSMTTSEGKRSQYTCMQRLSTSTRNWLSAPSFGSALAPTVRRSLT